MRYHLIPLSKQGQKISHQSISTVATIGAFDGLHLGHQDLIQRVKNYSHQHQIPSIIILFEPHPKEFFQSKINSNINNINKNNNSPISRISYLRDKINFLKKQKIDGVLILRFTQSLSILNPEDFFKSIFLDLLNIQHLIIGDDFKFGSKRAGDFDLIKKMSLYYQNTVNQFTVEPSQTISNKKYSRISSSCVREALKNGNFKEAESLLGRNYSIIGRVIYGDQIGRTLGFPTANIQLKHPSVLSGIYGVWSIINNKKYFGAASVGYRPSIQQKNPKQLLEITFFDLPDNLSLYGKLLEINFSIFIRKQAVFSDLNGLKQQIGKDCQLIREYFDLCQK